MSDVRGLDVTMAVFCELEDEYARWMTRNPLLQPRVGYLWIRYHGLIPAAIRHGGPTEGLGGLLISTEQKHRRQIENQLRDGFTPRTLDLMLVLLCREALTALTESEKEKESQIGWTCERFALHNAAVYHCNVPRHRRPQRPSEPRDARPGRRALGEDLPQRADHRAEPAADPPPLGGVVPHLVHGGVRGHGQGRPGDRGPRRGDQGQQAAAL